MADPLDALRLPPTPVTPDAAFADGLRSRLVDLLLAPLTKESTMTSPTTTSPTAVTRNGLRHGDVSYLTFRVPDAGKARAFYGALLGWTFDPGDPAPRSSVSGVRPEMGLSSHSGAPGVVLAYRVDDIAGTVDRIRAAGGTASDPVQRPYALEAECADASGIPFYLHEFDDGPTQTEDLRIGSHAGEVAYISLGVPDLSAAITFYGAAFGWSFSAGTHPQGRQVNGVAPMTGMWGGGEWTGARLAYRVDDLAASVAKIEALGGAAAGIDERPYGLACDDCVDDQGVPFMLLQLADG